MNTNYKYVSIPDYPVIPDNNLKCKASFIFVETGSNSVHLDSRVFCRP